MAEELSHYKVREALCERLRDMYAHGWATGTGGGISARVGDEVILAPTSVHKERVQPSDFSVKKLGGAYLEQPFKASQCTPIFEAIMQVRDAGAVAHSHGIYPVRAADLAGRKPYLTIAGLEMLKGVKDCKNDQAHHVPVINNAPEEDQLTSVVRKALTDPMSAKAYCVLVRNHGAYIWGKDIDEAKRHLEIYHFLFEAVWGRALGRALKLGSR